MSKRLLVIVPDSLSDIVKKGEFQPRYYNPGNYFEEVHILMTNMDSPDSRDLKRTVGEAELFLHNIPEPNFGTTLGFRPWLLREWAEYAVELSRKIRPDIIRCHGNWLNGYLASRIKKKLNVPYVLSMHTNPDEELRKRATSRGEWVYWRAMRSIEKVSLRNADLVLPVYEPIVPYLRSMRVKRFAVAYNVLDGESLRKKDDYTLHNPVRLISLGRHFREKDPANIIRAIKDLPQVVFTLVGDGPIQDDLKRVADECGVTNRVIFRPAVPNGELCRLLPSFDIFVVHTEYWEISKAVLEGLLTGLPVVLNQRKGMPVPELQGDHVLLVDNTPRGYFTALDRLIKDNAFRESLGRRAYQVAQERWAPAKTEAKYVEIYQKVMSEHEKGK